MQADCPSTGILLIIHQKKNTGLHVIEVVTRFAISLYAELISKPQTNHSPISLAQTLNEFHFSQSRTLRNGINA